MAKKISGSEIVIECLKEQGVDIVFGYPGGAILNVYDALYKHQEEITHVLTSHEQGAAHAADGYARATGKVGVCMATSGPGATNLVTGIATAYMDSVPMVAITANVGVNMLGKDSFQEIDIAGVVMPITKHSFIVKNVEDLAPTIRRAFKIAKSGRPGPVLVDITKDVTAAETEYTYEEPAVIERKTDTIREEDINKVIEMIKVSRRPYIMAGGGVIISGASEELKEFAEKVDAPVCDTLMGKGAYEQKEEAELTTDKVLAELESLGIDAKPMPSENEGLISCEISGCKLVFDVTSGMLCVSKAVRKKYAKDLVTWNGEDITTSYFQDKTNIYCKKRFFKTGDYQKIVEKFQNLK